MLRFQQLLIFLKHSVPFHLDLLKRFVQQHLRQQVLRIPVNSIHKTFSHILTITLKLRVPSKQITIGSELVELGVF
jgi:hypothetical protein